MSLKYKTSGRIALSELVISKTEKTKLINAGTAEKVWYGKGCNAWRAYVSIDDAISMGFQVKDSKKNEEFEAIRQKRMFNAIAMEAPKARARKI